MTIKTLDLPDALSAIADDLLECVGWLHEQPVTKHAADHVSTTLRRRADWLRGIAALTRNVWDVQLSEPEGG